MPHSVRGHARFAGNSAVMTDLARCSCGGGSGTRPRGQKSLHCLCLVHEEARHEMG